jgi:hypothetical protein
MSCHHRQQGFQALCVLLHPLTLIQRCLPTAQRDRVQGAEDGLYTANVFQAGLGAF